MSEPALLDDNHYHTDTEVSLAGLQTEDKPSKGGRLWPPTVSNVRHGHDSGMRSIGWVLRSTLTLQSEDVNEDTRRG